MVELNIAHWEHVENPSLYNRNLYRDTETDKYYLEVCDEDYGDYLYYNSNAAADECDWNYIGYTNREGSVDSFKNQNIETMKLDETVPT